MQFENKHYIVRVKDDLMGYDVINKASGVIEYEHVSLPRSIMVAEESSNYLNDKNKEVANAPNIVPIR